MADLDDLAAVATRFLESYAKMQDLSVLRQQLESVGEMEAHDEAPLYQRARIHLVSVVDSIVSIDVPLQVPLVRLACEALGLEMNERLQELSQVAPEVNYAIQEALKCQTKNPSTSPALGSTATTVTG